MSFVLAFFSSMSPPSGHGTSHPGHSALGHGSGDTPGLPATLSGLPGRARRNLWDRTAVHATTTQRHSGLHVCVWLPISGNAAISCGRGVTELCPERPREDRPDWTCVPRGNSGGTLPNRCGEHPESTQLNLKEVSVQIALFCKWTVFMLPIRQCCSAAARWLKGPFDNNWGTGCSGDPLRRERRWKVRGQGRPPTWGTSISKIWVSCCSFLLCISQTDVNSGAFFMLVIFSLIYFKLFIAVSIFYFVIFLWYLFDAYYLSFLFITMCNCFIDLWSFI